MTSSGWMCLPAFLLGKKSLSSCIFTFECKKKKLNCVEEHRVEGGISLVLFVLTLIILFFQEIEVEVELTANHWGRFEMFLCPNNNPTYEATQSCFDR